MTPEVLVVILLGVLGLTGSMRAPATHECLPIEGTLVAVAADLSPAVLTDTISSVIAERLGLAVYTGDMNGPGAHWVVVRVDRDYCLASLRHDLQSRWDRDALVRSWNSAVQERVPEPLDRATALDLAALFITYLIGKPVVFDVPARVIIEGHDEPLTMGNVGVQQMADGSGAIVYGVLSYGYDARWVVRISRRNGFVLEAASP